ncbi:MAG: hypothetical protein AAFV53_32555 [Myxococcota bacterium]
MFEWIRRLLTGPTPPDADVLPDASGVLVFYGLTDVRAGGLPDARTPSMVLPDLDPADAQRCFAPPPSPDFVRRSRGAFRAMLDDIDHDALRDPNSRARLAFLRRWLVELDPIEVVWHLEDAATAGDGNSWRARPPSS